MLNKATLPRANNGFASVTFDQKTPSIKKKLKNLLIGLVGRNSLLLNITALLLGRAMMFGELSPFGLSYFVAVRALVPSKTLYVAIWIALGFLWAQGPLAAVGFIIAATIALALERIYSARGARANWRWSAVALSAGLAVKIPWVLIEVPNLYVASILLIETALIAVLTIIFFSGVRLLLNPGLERTISSEEVVCLSILLAGGITGLNGLIIGQLSVKGIIAKFLVLFAAYSGGSHFAATTGVIIAMVSNITAGIILPQIGLYSFAGLLSGLFKDYKKFGVIIGFSLGYGLLTFYYVGSAALVTGLAEIALAGCLLLITSKRLSGAIENVIPGSVTILGNQARFVQRMQVMVSKQLVDFAQVFDSLADTFAPEETSHYDEENLNALMEELCDRVCKNCPRTNTCWGEELYPTYHALFNAVALAESNGSLVVGDMPQYLSQKCLYLDKFTAALNNLVEVYHLNYYWQKRMGDSKQLVAAQLAGVSKIVTELASDLRIDVDHQEELEESIAQELAALQIKVNDLHISSHEGGKLSVQIVKEACDNETQCTATIIPVVAAALGKQVSRGGARCASLSGKEECTLCLTTAQDYEVTCGVAQASADGSGVSGDSHAFVELPNGKIALLLSDGMGSGVKARQESETTVHILEKLLKTGFSKDAAVKTINAVLALRSPEETFATVDLGLIDLYSAQAEFVKIGASTTFCKRGRSVQMIRSSSLPIGILQDVVPDQCSLQLAVGDLVVMVSDGVLESQKDVSNKEEWLAKILEQAVSEHPQEIADYILERAKNNCRQELVDDMSVLVVKLDKNSIGSIRSIT